MRAFLKAADLCASEPERVARFLVDRGYVTTLDYAVQTLKELPYARWREYDPEDTARLRVAWARQAAAGYDGRSRYVGVVCSQVQQRPMRDASIRLDSACSSRRIASSGTPYIVARHGMQKRRSGGNAERKSGK